MPKRIAVLTDSSCDLSPEQIEAFGLHLLPLKLHFAGRDWADHLELTPEVMFEQLEKTPMTPAPSMLLPDLGEYMALVEHLLSTHDQVFSMHTSPLLGRVYQLVFHASQAMPQRLTAFNSNSTAGGLALQVLRAKRLFGAGLSVPEVVEKLRLLHQDQVTRINVTTLDGFRRAKLIGPVQALMGEWRGIKPILGLQNGRLEVLAQVQGHEAAAAWMVDELKQLAAGKSGLQINFGHNGDPEALDMLRVAAREL